MTSRLPTDHDARLLYVECGRVQPEGVRGWRAYLTAGEDERRGGRLLPGVRRARVRGQPARRRRLSSRADCCKRAELRDEAGDP